MAEDAAAKALAKATEDWRKTANEPGAQVVAVHPDAGETTVAHSALNPELKGGLYSKGWRAKEAK